VGAALPELSEETKPKAGEERLDELHSRWPGSSLAESGLRARKERLALLVPRTVSDLAEVGWGVSNLVLAWRSGGHWRLAQVGTVYGV